MVGIGGLSFGRLGYVASQQFSLQVPFTQEVVEEVDTEAPSVPTGLVATKGSWEAALTWNASTDNVAVTGYNIYVDDVLHATVGAVTSTTISPVDPGRRVIKISAIDAAENESAKSSGVNCDVQHGIKVSSDGRRFVTSKDEDIYPVFDTCWGLITLTTSELTTYFADRRDKGFAGILGPNVYGANKPNNTGSSVSVVDLTNGSSALYSKLDEIVDMAEQYGLLLMFVFQWGLSTRMDNYGSQATAVNYVDFITKRYDDRPNVFWCVCGEYSLEASNPNDMDNLWVDYWEAMGDEVALNVPSDRLIGIHPYPGEGIALASSSGRFHSETWCRFNQVQTWTHEDYAYDRVSDDLNLSPQKPCFMSETKYEDSASEGTRVELRWDNWRSAFAGGCALGYGQEKVYQGRRLNTWSEMTTGMAKEGANDAVRMGTFMEARLAQDNVWAEQLGYIVGTPTEHVQLCESNSKKWLAAYVTDDATLTLTSASIVPYSTATWFNPRTGATQSDTLDTTYSAPTNEDWVLLLEE